MGEKIQMALSKTILIVLVTFIVVWGSLPSWLWAQDAATYENSARSPMVIAQKNTDINQLIERARQVGQRLADLATLLAGDGSGPPDPKYWFTKSYVYVTDNIIRLVEEGRFRDPEAVLTEVVLFESLYTHNLSSWIDDRKEQVVDHWQTAFKEMDRAGVKHPDRAFVEGIKAHIRGDLSTALAEAYQVGRTKDAALQFRDMRSDYENMMPAFDNARESLVSEMRDHPILRMGANITVVRDWVFSVQGERALAFIRAAEKLAELGQLTSEDNTWLEATRTARMESNSDPTKPFPPFFPPGGGGGGRSVSPLRLIQELPLLEGR